MPAIVLAEADSVAVAVEALYPGEAVLLSGAVPAAAGPAAAEAIPAGHKIALRDIVAGGTVLKYGRPIGRAARDIAAGSHVHTHNLRSELSARDGGPPSGPVPEGGGFAWRDRPRLEALLRDPAAGVPAAFEGYLRSDGRVGVRNELWIVPAVGCVNGTAEAAARIAREEFGLEAFPLLHPLGCSQLGGDLESTRSILARLARHPNAGGALVLSLGCESNRLPEFRQALGDFDPARLRFVSMQDEGDELEAARRAVAGIAARMAGDSRTSLPLSRLRVGLKCGGSDAFSGITANPLVGRVCELLVAAGAGLFMSEVPEMFGAEEELYARCADEGARSSAESMIEGFKRYYAAHGQPVYENPSPGNKEGGITTLEEKSLGCVRKSGGAPVAGVLPYAGASDEGGLRLVSGPGNDLVSSTALAAAGAQLVLFTTGRGTPFGAQVPTLKISSTSALAARKPGWIDFDAGRVLEGASFDALALELLRELVAVAGGRRTKAELAGHRGIAIFKEGVTL